MSDSPHLSQNDAPDPPNEERENPPRMKLGALRHGPVILLIGLVVIHAYAVHGHSGDPWRLGGYGMFSVPLTRYVNAKIIDEHGRAHHVSATRIWRPFPRRYNRARALPDEASLCALAERLAGLRWTGERASKSWRLRDAIKTFNEAPERAGSPPVTLDGAWLARRTVGRDAPNELAIDRLEVQVAKLVYDRDESQARRQPLTSVVWTKDDVCLPR